jgi:Mce-associated membrane protein
MTAAAPLLRPRPAGPVRVLVPAALTVLLVVLAVAYGLTSHRESTITTTESARTAAAAAAVAEVPQVLSYSYKTLTADVAAAKADTTGQFASDYAALASSYVDTQVPKGQIVTVAKVTGSSVVHATSSTVVVLLFVDQTTTGTSLTAPKLNTSTVEATMQHVGSRWLVSDLTVVPQATTAP